jgi:hypothetical protein
LRLFENPAAAYSQTLAFLGLSEYRATYEVHNARSYPDISADEEEFLAGKFAESNERLVEMLGPEFDFRRA